MHGCQMVALNYQTNGESHGSHMTAIPYLISMGANSDNECTFMCRLWDDPQHGAIQVKQQLWLHSETKGREISI